MTTISTPREVHTNKPTWLDFPLGLGTGRLCSLNGGISVSRAARLLHQACDLGVRFVDTAPTYGQGQVESAIGRLPVEVRERLFLCSKVGYSFGRKTQLINAAKPLLRPVLPWIAPLRSLIASTRHRANQQGGGMHLTIEPASIRSTLDDILRRVRRDCLDLFLLHDPSEASVCDAANHDELDRLVRAGKIRSWGISTSDASVAAKAIGVPQCAVIQIPVFPGWVDQHPAVLEQCAAGGKLVIANSVLTPLVQRTAEDAARQAVSTVEQCLEFALHKPGVRIALCGTRTLAHLEHNVQIVRQLIGAN